MNERYEKCGNIQGAMPMGMWNYFVKGIVVGFMGAQSQIISHLRIL